MPAMTGGPPNASGAVAADNGRGRHQLFEERQSGLAAHPERVEDGGLREPQDGAQVDPVQIHVAHPPAREPALADFRVVEEGDVLVARVAQDAAVDLVHRGAAPLEHLDEDVAFGGGAEDAGETVRRVVSVGLLEDRGDERLVDRGVRAAGVEEADEHLFSPYFVRPARSERNSLRRSGFFRNEPRMTLFVIFVSESFTPRHFMQ